MLQMPMTGLNKTLDHLENNCNRILADKSLEYPVTLQCQQNIPMLVLTSIYIRDLASSLNIEEILFSSRDCRHLKKVFDSLFTNEISSKYFYTSRISLQKASPGYCEYLTSMIGTSSLIVDLCGTGYSFGSIFKKLNIQPTTLFVHDLGALQTRNMIKTYEHYRPNNLINIFQDPNLNNVPVEIANYTSEEMLLDIKVTENESRFSPIFSHTTYPSYIKYFINAVEVCIEEATTSKPDLLLKVKNHLQDITKKMIRNRIQQYYVDIVKSMSNMDEFIHFHISRDQVINSELNTINIKKNHDNSNYN